MTSGASATPARRALARHLHGDGLELGPGHEPFPLPPTGASVRYVDRWQPEENAELFPELDDPEFPVPDVVADLDVDRLGAVADASVDFVIASHVLEHLADPIGMIDEIHRVLRVGGVAIILLPDRRTTFDAARPPTPLDHLVAEHADGVTTVSDEHITEFVGAVDGGKVPSAAEIDHQRRRSIHVHCWSEDEFPAVLVHGVTALGQHWHFVDGLRTGDPASVGIEFGYVLQKDRRWDTADCAARLQRDWQVWFRATSDGTAEASARQARIDAREASTSRRSTAPLRALSARLRRRRRWGVGPPDG